MINLSSLRENPELITQNILKKDPTFPVAELIKLDENLRLKLIEVEDLRFKRNEKAKRERKRYRKGEKENRKRGKETGYKHDKRRDDKTSKKFI